MKKTFILLPALAMLVFAATSCTQKVEKGPAAVTNPPTKSVSMPDQPEGELATPALTSINFEATKFNFGEKKATDDFTHTFTFTNTGENDLILQNVKGSCSCTVTKYTKEAIQPGESGTVTAKFNPKKDFTGSFKKNITVTANVEPANLILEIAGEVVN
jgi:hypothetical protein